VDAETPAVELILLSRLLELCRHSPDIRSVLEHFRGDDLEHLVREIETSSLDGTLNDEELIIQFQSTWSKFLLLAEKAEYHALSEKSLQAPLTDAEKTALQGVSPNPA
jgi:hypothetical protein